MKRILPCIMTMETTTVEDSKDWENLKALKNFQIGIGRLPLWNLADYGSRQCPRSRCIGERLEHGELKKTQSSVKENPKAGEINYGEIAHGNDKSRNTAIHDVIVRLCYCHRADLSMQMHGRIGW